MSCVVEVFGLGEFGLSRKVAGDQQKFKDDVVRSCLTEPKQIVVSAVRIRLSGTMFIEIVFLMVSTQAPLPLLYFTK